MTSQPQPQLTRRLVTGINAEGRSTIVRDTETPTWVRRPTGAVVMDVWRIDSLPAHVNDESTEGRELQTRPPANGVSVRIAVFPPDTEIDQEGVAAYESSLQEIYGDQGATEPSQIAGMHRTDTIDVLTVVKGELTIVMEDGESLLKAGDCVVQRGTRHAWRNRSNQPCTVVTTTVSAIPK